MATAMLGLQKLFLNTQLTVWSIYDLERTTILYRFNEILLVLTLTRLYAVAYHSDFSFDTLLLLVH